MATLIPLGIIVTRCPIAKCSLDAAPGAGPGAGLASTGIDSRKLSIRPPFSSHCHCRLRPWRPPLVFGKAPQAVDVQGSRPSGPAPTCTDWEPTGQLHSLSCPARDLKQPGSEPSSGAKLSRSVSLPSPRPQTKRDATVSLLLGASYDPSNTGSQLPQRASRVWRWQLAPRDTVPVCLLASCDRLGRTRAAYWIVGVPLTACSHSLQNRASLQSSASAHSSSNRYSCAHGGCRNTSLQKV